MITQKDININLVRAISVIGYSTRLSSDVPEYCKTRIAEEENRLWDLVWDGVGQKEAEIGSRKEKVLGIIEQLSELSISFRDERKHLVADILLGTVNDLYRIVELLEDSND